MLAGSTKLTKDTWMVNEFPNYHELDITKYSLIAGVYTLGLIDKHRPDIEIIHGWTDDHQQTRIRTMINDNKDLITDSKDVYQSLQSDLEQARWTIGKNMYNFFVQQLAHIPQIN